MNKYNDLLIKVTVYEHQNNTQINNLYFYFTK